MSKGWRLGLALAGVLLWSGCARVAFNPEVPRHATPPAAPEAWLALWDAASSATVRRVEAITLTSTETALLADLPTTLTRLAETTGALALRAVDVYAWANAPQANRRLAQARQAWLQAAWEVPAQYGRYDLLLSADATQTYLDPAGGSPALERRAGAGLSQLLPWGTLLEARVDGLRTRRAPDDAPPAYDAVATLRARQPLLRGRGREATEAGLLRARLDRTAAEYGYLARRRAEVAGALNDYWNWRGAREALQARLSALAAARELVRINTARVAEEAAPRIEQLQAEATAAQRLGDVLEARRAVDDAADALRRRLLSAPEVGHWLGSLAPGEPLVVFALSVESAQALAGRPADWPEVRRADVEVARGELEVRLARQARQPLLDAVAGVEWSGQGTGPGAARDDLCQGRDYAWSAGVEFSFPFQNRAARYRHRQAEAALARAREQALDVRQGVEQTQRAALHALAAAAASFAAAEQRITSARGNLAQAMEFYVSGLALEFTAALPSGEAAPPDPAAEADRNETGATITLSPTLELLRFQADYAAALESRAQAATQHQQALVQLVFGGD